MASAHTNDQGWVKEKNGGRGRGLLISLALSLLLNVWWVAGGYDRTKPFFDRLDALTVGKLGWTTHTDAK